MDEGDVNAGGVVWRGVLLAAVVEPAHQQGARARGDHAGILPVGHPAAIDYLGVPRPLAGCSQEMDLTLMSSWAAYCPCSITSQLKGYTLLMGAKAARNLGFILSFYPL
jgi:hypothetical protein